MKAAAAFECGSFAAQSELICAAVSVDQRADGSFLPIAIVAGS
jgi:hypothetical protein